MDDLRLRLIERLCRLPAPQLTSVEELLDRLEGRSDRTENSTQAHGALAHVSSPHQHWPHAPTHRLSEHGSFIVTASTLHKDHFFRGPDGLTLLQDQLLLLALRHDIVLEAWAVFSNHYHFVAHTGGLENQLANMLTQLHYDTAEEINRRCGCPGRQIWFNYWDTQLTFEKSYLARLNYVHHNAVKHGLVAHAIDYPWCSAGWFERMATRAQVRTIYGFKTDRVKVEDDFQPVI